MADETREALIKLAQAVDRLSVFRRSGYRFAVRKRDKQTPAFAAAGLAAYVAHLPGADAVDAPAVKETARTFMPEPVCRGFVPPLIVATYAMIDHIEAAAKSTQGQPGKGM
jgi:hypothetical protein